MPPSFSQPSSPTPTDMNSLLAKLTRVASAIWNFYLPLFRSESARTLAALLPLAVVVVRELAKMDVPSGDKRESAVILLKRQAIEEGLHAAESLIRYSIESAVFKLKEDAQ